ncbi:SDR family oxidoreductase [Candidatus Pacearchaeota archaeon]|nr:SDR family oxidoreductase [Candidatus Pacearchaeota archaeon]
MIKKETKVLVTGCGGMLGEAVYHEFKSICQLYPTDKDINEPWLEHLDITDFAAIKRKIITLKPDYVLHLAALTDMEYCEKNPEEAFLVNAKSPEYLAKLTAELGIPMAYISTAGVFNGEKEEYHDDEMASPLSVYGKSKYQGEHAVKTLNPQHFVFRAGWMVGGGPTKDKKFINKIMKQIQAGKTELAVIDDKLGSPSYTYDLAKIMRAVIDREKYGVYNSVCEGGGSRYEVAEIILQAHNLHDKISLKKVDSSYFKQDYFAPRPRSEKLVNTNLKSLGITIPRDWKVCLQEYMEMYDWKVPNLIDKSFQVA